MKNEKKETYVLLSIVLVVIAILIGIFIAYSIMDNKDMGVLDDSNNNHENNDMDDAEDDYNILGEISFKDYNFVLKDKNVKLDEIFEWSESDMIGNNLKYANVKITGFKLDGKESIVQFKNLPSNSNCVFDSNNKKEMSVNGVTLISYEYEGCYIVNFNGIFILDNTFVGVHYSGEDIHEIILIADKDGNKVYYNDNVIDFNYNDYTFKSYEDDDKEYILNTYKLVLESNKIKKVLVSRGSESLCDMNCGEGMPCC